ncbi:MAG: acetyl-CoA carboxylase biotin carboxyl carrier protein [Alphaproteobacteria bacterium]|nr:acetyl-CoA carboxylase biotin carboxyl carrier protein [Alphaproteobacteria bacterium]
MPTKFDLDTAFVRKLAKLLEETGLSEIEYAEGDKKIRCAVARGHVVHAAPAVAPVAASSAPTASGGAAHAAPAGAITAPMVGTVYLTPSPDAAAFVKAGDRVKAGDTLLIIEAMKVMNPIKATQAGTIAEILVTNGKPVEFGEALMVMN